MYKPLPDLLTIKKSSIHNLGLFAAADITQGTNFGMTHLQFNDQLIRTPLGGFLNHSDNPNCEKTKLRFTNMDNAKLQYDFKKWNLLALRDIKKGEELTICYTFYKVYGNENKKENLAETKV